MQVDIDAAGKQADVDVRGHRDTGSVVHHAGLDGLDGPLTGIEGGGSTTEAVEGVFQVVVILVLAIGIGLPEFQE
ncbi:hypothetical protein D3C81_2030950 [compost metagenome]